MKAMYIKLSILSLFIFCTQSVAFAQTVTVVTNLTFGDVFPGVSKTIQPQDAGSAEFKVTGDSSKDAQFTFTLPSHLTDATGNQLSITFATDAGRHSSDELVSESYSFDPKDGFTAGFSLTGERYVWVGGTVHPASTQSSGSYSADITMDVAYITN